MQELIERRNNLENELKSLEKQIYDLETPYLEETQNTGEIRVFSQTPLYSFRKCAVWMVKLLDK